mmetsp:Transcript_8462/g.16642  ORF Transcript_8462/g.16642 Transcript_8462/m.16642 type:complete len:315 (+) Transcript_8462:2228-3172(+)
MHTPGFTHFLLETCSSHYSTGVLVEMSDLNTAMDGRKAWIETITHTFNGVVAMAIVLQCIYYFTGFAEGSSLLTDPRLIDNMTNATFSGFAVFLIILFEMVCFRNPKGATFWERYGDTPAMYLAIALIFAHCLGFGCYVIVSIVTARNTLDPADNTDTMPKALKEMVDIFYWPHAVGMMVCMIATVLQFVPQIRTWKKHAFHRWNGWLIMVASTIGVLAAFVINTLELYIPNRYGSLNTSIHFWMESLDFYVTGVGALTSSTLGAYYAVKRDVPRHAAWMHRLVAWWFSASAARIYFVPLLSLFADAAGFQAAP